MLYTSNRYNHLFIVNRVAAASDLEGGHLKASAPVGTAHVRTSDDLLYLEYMGPGGVITSDYIGTGRVLRVSTAAGAADCRPLSARVIRLTDVRGVGNDADGTLKDQALPGQDYLLTIRVGGYIGLDHMDARLMQASARGRDGMTNSELYARLAHSLALNIAGLPDPMVRVMLLTGTGEEVGREVVIRNNRVMDKLDDILADGAKYTGILVRERVDEDYEQGLGEEVPADISVQARRVTHNEASVTWCEDRAATVDRSKVYGVGGCAAGEAHLMPNGRRAAELEYWSMGERGDQERHRAWPNNVRTTYVADPRQVYDWLNIRYYWAGAHEEVQRSERELTVAAPHYSDLAAGTAGTVLNDLIKKINATKLMEAKAI